MSQTQGLIDCQILFFFSWNFIQFPDPTAPNPDYLIFYFYFAILSLNKWLHYVLFVSILTMTLSRPDK